MARGPSSLHHIDAPLTLITLGGARLLAADGTELLSTGKPLALLAYLACAPRRTLSREHLLDLLWSDLDPEHARHALRQTLWFLRRTVGAETLVARNGDLVLGPALQVDRDRFLDLIDAGELEAAAACYHGEFLAGFAAPGSVELEHWADAERQLLRGTFLRILNDLVRGRIDGGRFEEARHLARRAREAARGNEATWRLLLEVHLAAGDRLGFGLDAAALDQMLAAEGREPEPATRALLQRPPATPDSSATPDPQAPGLVPALVGREKEFGTIIAAWTAVRSGAGRCLHLTAPPGLGKTRLLTDVRRRLRALGAPVVYLRANPGDRAIPFSFASELTRLLGDLPGATGVSPSSAATLVGLNATLSSRFPVSPDPSTGDEALRRRSTALGELLSAVSDERPLALLLDDLHWADPVSRRLLRPLLERSEQRAMLVVSAARPVAGVGLEGESATTLWLAALTSPQVGELLASLGQLPPEPWATSLAEAVTRSSGGSPLLVLETLQLALDAGVLTLHEGGWACPAPGRLAAQLETGGALLVRVQQLDPEPQQTLLLLALAGTPLPVEQLAHAAGRDRALTDATLLELEQRGLVQRLGDLWQPAHDEIAALAAAGAPEAERRAAHRGLGEAFQASPTAGRAELARAGHHFLQSDEWVELRRAFLRYVRLARAEGDGRRLRFLLADFLPETDHLTRDRLLQRLGRLTRIRHAPTVLLTTAGLLVLLAGAVAVAAALPWGDPPDAALDIIPTDSMGRVPRLELRRRDWEAGRGLSASRGPSALRALSRPTMGGLKHPFENLWAHVLPVADSGVNDVFLLRSDGTDTRVTFAPRDDSPQSWAPDGSRLVISTARWSPHGADDYDLAILDPKTGHLRQLTSGTTYDAGAVWSPEGTRIAFYRRYPDFDASTPDQVCWVTLEQPGRPRCQSLPWGDLLAVAGWLDPGRLMLLVDSAGVGVLVRFDLETGVQEVIRRDAESGSTSPDGRWILIRARAPGLPGPTTSIAPASSPGQDRLLPPPFDGWPTMRMIWDVPVWRGYLDSVRMVAATTAVPLGVSTKLRFEARAADGRPMTVLVAPTWTSRDTSIARVDSTGLLRPRRAGGVWVLLSLGGWRCDSLQLTVVGVPARQVLRERWGSDWEDRWRPYGDPAPAITNGPGGTTGFWSRGDGSYSSGAISRDAWDPAGGLGVEALALTPITRTQWQAWSLSFAWARWEEVADSVNLDRAHVPPLDLRRAEHICNLSIPGGEGSGAVKQVALSLGLPQWVPMGPWIRERRWYRVRMQIFPDGRCGVALNGVPALLSNDRIFLTQPLRLFLGYASAQTTILHGPLEVWQGVRTDIDWGQLDTLPGQLHPLPERP